jgi:hypothetical protein
MKRETKLSEAQLRRLAMAPNKWQTIPFISDSRPLGPLIRKGMIEVRRIDRTPADWQAGVVRVVETQWRITRAGRALWRP